MINNPDVLIVGGGILGMMTATQLALVEQKVCILDADAERASEASLVWLNVISTETAPYARLRVASMQRWHSIVETDPTCPVEIKGSLLWDRDRDGLEKLCDFQNGLGWKTEIIGRDAFCGHAPGILDTPDAALFAPDEGAAHPGDILRWAKDRAIAAGVVFQSGSVASIQTAGGRARGVRLADDTGIDCDRIILTAGHGCGPLLRPFGIDAGLRDAPGMLLITTPVAPISARVMASPRMDFWQADDGRILVATGTHQTMVDDLEASAHAALQSLKTMIADDAGLQVQSRQMRNRPIPRDGFPVVGAVPNIDGLWLGLCHSGMTLAPAISAGLTDLATGKDLGPMFDWFGVNRFRA